MNEPARVMMYSQDSYGLGHLRRATNLANALVAQRTDLSVLLVVDSPVAPFFELRDRIDFVKLPTVVKVDAGVFETGRLLTGYEPVKTMRANIIREVCRGFRPDLVLVDHLPGGANRELLPTLRMIRRSRHPTKIVLGLRDVIDTPERICALWRREKIYETLEQYYERILIYGSKDFYSTATEYRIPKKLHERTQYCGYVCNMDPVKDPQRVRAKLGLDHQPIVAVMAGGGSDAYRLMQTYLDAVRLMGDRVPFATIMVTGSFMPELQRKTLRKQAKVLGVHVHWAVGDTLSLIGAAEVIVTMAGYNTLGEILRFGKKAIVVPRVGPSSEQQMRARIFEDKKLIRMLEPQELCPEQLAQAVREELAADRPRKPMATPNLQGIARVTETLLNLLAADVTPHPSDTSGVRRTGFREGPSPPESRINGVP